MLKSPFHRISIGRRIIRIAVCSRRKAVRKEGYPAALFSSLIHVALKIASSLITRHKRRGCSPVARTILAHNIRATLPASIADSSDHVTLQNLVITRCIAVRISKRHNAIFLAHLVIESSLGRINFANRHCSILGMRVAMACDFVTGFGQFLNTAPIEHSIASTAVRPVGDDIERRLITILIEHGQSDINIALRTIVKSEGNCGLAETGPSGNFGILSKNHGRTQGNQGRDRKFFIIHTHTLLVLFSRLQIYIGGWQYSISETDYPL